VWAARISATVTQGNKVTDTAKRRSDLRFFDPKPTPKPSNWHRSSCRPSDCGIRASAIRLAMQGRLSNCGPKLLLGTRIEAANVLGDRALLTEMGRPEVVERSVIHSDDQHCVADIGKAGSSPARGRAGSARRSRRAEGIAQKTASA
jgi:hypothetical protein